LREISLNTDRSISSAKTPRELAATECYAFHLADPSIISSKKQSLTVRTSSFHSQQAKHAETDTKTLISNQQATQHSIATHHSIAEQQQQGLHSKIIMSD